MTSQSKDEELKPCPFCGVSPGCVGIDDDRYYVACISLMKCAITPMTPSYKTKRTAIAAWNRRKA